MVPSRLPRRQARERPPRTQAYPRFYHPPVSARTLEKSSPMARDPCPSTSFPEPIARLLDLCPSSGSASPRAAPRDRASAAESAQPTVK